MGSAPWDSAMGQHHSTTTTRDTTSFPHCKDDSLVSPGIFGFVSILLGNGPSFLAPNISCADAIVDLAAEATELSCLTEIQWETLDFSPYVLSEQYSQLDDLPSMPPLTRFVFFNNSVRIVAKNSAGSIRIFTIPQVSKMNILFARLAELAAIQRSSNQNSRTSSFSDDEYDNECGICMDCPPECLLPCGHQLCARCEKLWVRRKLDCPFCRNKFRNSQQVADQSWELAQSRPVNEIDQDIDYLMEQIQSCFVNDHGVISTDEVTSCLKQEGYEPIKRQIDPFADERDGFIFL